MESKSKKKKSLVIPGVILIFIISNLVMGLFEAYVKSLPYFVALYNVLEGLLKGVWLIISTPTVFLPLLTIYILIRYKIFIVDTFNKLLPRVKKAGIGGASVELDTEQVIKDVSGDFPLSEENKIPLTIEDFEVNQGVRKLLISQMHDRVLDTLLRIDGKILNSDEFLYLFRDIGREIIPSMDKQRAESFSVGLIYTIFSYNGILLIVDNYNKFSENRILIMEGVRELMLEKINRKYEPLIETKENTK